MPRILFVDDEPKVLDALRALLRKFNTWELSFVEGGERGLEIIQQESFDIVVSDLKMPKVDGALLLQSVQKLHPQAVRIVLANANDQGTALKAVSVAHQFLGKPCDPTTLESTLERACQIHALIKDPALRSVLGRVQRLPTMPGTWVRLRQVMDSPSSNSSQIAAVLRQDMAITARILQLVNSPFFGPSRKITALEDAVSYLGFNLIRSLVFSLELFQSPSHSWYSQDDLRHHVLLSATIARRVVPERRLADEAFFAAILHDVGLLVLADQPAAASDPTLHPRIGAYLLSLWGMENSLIDAALNHHQPPSNGRFTITTAVHIADILAQRQLPFNGCPPGELDMRMLKQLGVEDRLSSWDIIAKEAKSSLGVLG